MVVEKKKYIIELPENVHWIQWIMESTKDHHPYMDFKQVEDLTPYTEDSAYAHGYTEAESKYREIRDELEKQAYQRGYEEAYDTAYADAEEIYESGKRAMYQKGLKDAWWYMQKILLPSWLGGYGGDVIREIFEIEENHNIEEAVLNYSASEAIEKIRQYEQKQEESEEPKKEQSVTVEEVMRQYLETFCHGRSCMSCPLNAPNFTCGRGYHFITNPVSDEEVRRAYTTVLQKMKEN